MKTEYKTIEVNVLKALKTIFDRPNRPMSNITHKCNPSTHWKHEFGFTVEWLCDSDLQVVKKALEPCEQYFKASTSVILIGNPEPFGTGVRVIVTWLVPKVIAQ